MIRKKNRWLAVSILMLLLLTPATAFAQEEQSPAQTPTPEEYQQAEEQAQQEFEEDYANMLNGLDFSSLDQRLQDDSLAQGILGSGTIRDLVDKAARGELDMDAGGMLQAIGSLFFSQIRAHLYIILEFVALAVLMSLMGAVGPKVLSGEVSELCSFIAYLVAIGFAVHSLSGVFAIGVEAISEMTGLMQSIFPVMLTLLTAIGSSISAGIFKPAMTLLTGTIITLVQKVSLPAILVSGLLTIVQHISPKVQIEQMTKLVMKCAQWLTTVVFVIFLGVTALQGLSGAAFDGITIRTAKFAINKFVPIVGGMFSDTVDTLIGCGVVIKQGVGMIGLILLATTALRPVLQIMAIAITYKIAAAVIEPFGEKRLTSCLSGLSHVFTLLYIAVLAAGAMMFILTTLMIRAGNINVMMR